MLTTTLSMWGRRALQKCEILDQRLLMKRRSHSIWRWRLQLSLGPWGSLKCAEGLAHGDGGLTISFRKVATTAISIIPANWNSKAGYYNFTDAAELWGVWGRGSYNFWTIWTMLWRKSAEKETQNSSDNEKAPLAVVAVAVEHSLYVTSFA